MDIPCEWNIPCAGMFVWIKLKQEIMEKIGIENTKELIWGKAKDAKVLMLPGEAFFSENDCLLESSGRGKYSKGRDCVRTAFSVASEEDMDEGLRRFAGILRWEL